MKGTAIQDTQSYKSEAEVEAEWSRDPLPKLKSHCAGFQIGDEDWERLESEVAWEVGAARAEAETRGISEPEVVTDHVFFEGEMQAIGGIWNSGYEAPASTDDRGT